MSHKPPREWTDQPRRPEPLDNLTGRTLAGRFRLGDREVHTQTSCVYRGHDLRGRVAVAVKILRAGLDAAAEERFRREGQILAKLRHAHVADFIDCGVTEDGLCYLVTAWIDGRSLAGACDDSAPLTLENVWRVGLQVASALAFAHDRGVFHRDVKPSNILWSRGVAKLMDFGSAKLREDADLEVTPVRHPTAIGMPIGTPGYLPPEASDQIDARTDVFALGRTLYRLIARRPATAAPAGLDCPEPLRRVLLDAMHPDPSERIASAEEFHRRWLAAGEQVWPPARLADVALHPAPQLWPPPPDLSPAPPPADLCDGREGREVCAATTVPQLFERRLELRRRLGKGRCGETWRAYHHLLRRDVAVKIVPRTLGAHIVAGLCREAVALDKLTHRAFPRVLECDYAADGSWYMIEEYIDGETLSQTFERAPLDPLVAIDIVTEIAEALCEAHARGILHGDIQPGNVILERALPSPRPRVIDLSECRLGPAFFADTDQRYAPSPVHHVEVPGTFGHPHFAAPELRRGEPKSAASEVYALGVVLFILLTGQRGGALTLRDIFAAGDREEAGDHLRAMLTSVAPELRDTFIADEFHAIVAPEPERRVATMADLLDKLRVEGDALRDLRTQGTELSRPVVSEPTAEPAMATANAAALQPAAPAETPAAAAVPARPRWRRTVGAALASMLVAATVIAIQIAGPSGPEPEPASVPSRDAPPVTPVDALPATPVVRDAATLIKSTDLTTLPAPSRAQLLAALTGQLPALTRCPDVPARLTLAIEVGARVTLAEVQHDEVDPVLPFDRCVRAIVESLELPSSDITTRHVVTLPMGGAARQ